MVFASLLAVVAPSDEPQVRADVPVFGQRGQLVLRGVSNAQVYGVHERLTLDKSPATKADAVGFNVSPSVGAFVIDNLLVGGLVDVGFSYQSHLYAVNAAVGPYVGYRVGISPMASFLPTLGVVYNFQRAHVTSGTTPTNLDAHQLYLRLHTDFVFHLSHRVSLTAGPFVHQSVYSHQANVASRWDTTYGVNVGVLGWL